jgi:hypothetical protein
MKKITKEEFEAANKVVTEYNEQLNKSLIKSRVCACCKTKEVKPLEGTGLSEGHIKASRQEQGCWNDGTVERISFGYGSKHDMRSFYVAICDSCIDELLKTGLITDVKTLEKIERTELETNI